MKEMEKLVKRFNRLNPEYHAAFHPEWSDISDGYVVCISDPFGYSTRYTFARCRDFREWMDGVVLD